MRTSEALAHTAGILERDGWVQGNYGMLAEAGTPKCITGALCAALDLEPVGEVDPSVDGPIYGYGSVEFTPPYRAVMRHLSGELEPKSYHQLWQWNDDDYTTRERVIEVLRTVATAEAAREQKEKAA